MPSITLAESAKLTQNDLVMGVIEEIITVNRFFDILPFDPIDGNALAYNREDTLGDAEVIAVGGMITAKAAATVTQVTTQLTTIVGDAEVNGLIQATRSNSGVDQKANQIASKAKSVGRKFQNMLINGSGASAEFEGMINLTPDSQKVASATNGQDLSFDTLDNMIDLVVDKDGEVDYFTMHSRTIRAYMALLRALGGAGINEVIMLPSGREVQGYRGVPIFRNDWIPTDQTQGSSSNATTIFAGTLDDGTEMHGISGLTAANEMGIQIEEVGPHHTKDETITRVKWYSSLALFNQRGIAAATGITN